MGRNHFVLCDSDMVYGLHFIRWVKKHGSLALQLHLYSSIQKAIDFTGETQTAIAVIDSDFSSEDRAKIKADSVFVLTKNQMESLLDQEVGLYKYQSARRMVEEMVQVCQKRKLLHIFPSKEAGKKKWLGVYSPLPIQEQTRWGLSWARKWSEKGRCLYICGRTYSGWNYLVPQEQKKGLARAIYGIRQEQMPWSTETIVGRLQCVDVLGPMETQTDFKEVSWQEWERFFAYLENNTSYQTIIFEVDETMEGLEKFLARCHNILCCYKGQDHGVTKDVFCQMQSSFRQFKLDTIWHRILWKEENH